MKKYYFFILFIGVFSIYACHKNDEPSRPSTASEPDVYLAGYEFNATSNFAIATYWKNGIPIRLTDGSYWAEAHAITVSGNDVYVVGFENLPNEPFSVATCWKNGSALPFINGKTWGEANSVLVADNNVYIAGTIPSFHRYNLDGTTAVYWKNGNQVNLTPDSISSSAASIAVSGNDVYVSGQEFYKHYDLATYWKNGQANFLDTSGGSSFAPGITVSGNDVYVTAAIGSKAIYTKNGESIELEYNGSPYHTPTPTGIAVSNNDVYVSGYGFNINNNGIGLYWKNGKPIAINSEPVTGSLNAIAVSVNHDVYTAGSLSYLNPVDYAAKYWKNDKPVMTIDSASVAYLKAIYLVNK